MIIIVVIWSWSHHGFSSAMTPIPSWSPGPATWSAARWNSSDWPRVKRSRGKRMGSKMGKRNPQIAIFMDIIHDIYWYMILYIYIMMIYQWLEWAPYFQTNPNFRLLEASQSLLVCYGYSGHRRFRWVEVWLLCAIWILWINTYTYHF